MGAENQQALQNSCELLRQRRELHASSWNCMQAYVTACKLMYLHAFWNILEHTAWIMEHSETFCMHSETFWNFLHAYWNIPDHSACIMEHAAYAFCNILVNSGTFWNILEYGSASILEHSGIWIWKHSGTFCMHSGTFCQGRLWDLSSTPNTADFIR